MCDFDRDKRKSKIHSLSCYQCASAEVLSALTNALGCPYLYFMWQVFCCCMQIGSFCVVQAGSQVGNMLLADEGFKINGTISC